ncbi:MAG: c-type cytochrome [Sphingomonadaceae bacterium]|jgi:cytochrome c|nr:c-type cytochrome [Sphingomonadaceae bacterium]
MNRALVSAAIVGIAVTIGIGLPETRTLAASAKTTPPPPAFQACAACHTISNDRANGMGPNLRGIFGRRAATVQGFNYSNAMKRSKIIWNASEIDAFIANPRAKVPGNSMAYVGMKNEAQRAQVVSYLKSLK